MNINTKAISLIIPSKDSKKKLLELLRSIPNWEAVPNEIIIVDSSENKLEVPKDIKLFVENFNIRLLVKIEKNLFPGHARNIGINNSSNSLLAFLDTSTHPNKNWPTHNVVLWYIAPCSAIFTIVTVVSHHE